MKTITVVAAVIKEGEDILCVRRPPNKKAYISEKWEFPGGKVEAGESYEAALTREIQEELSYAIAVGERLITVDHPYPDFRLIMHAYLCTALDRDFTLHEHIDALWLQRNRLEGLDWAAADLPIVELLMKERNGANECA